jgi:hypothetical protein
MMGWVLIIWLHTPFGYSHAVALTTADFSSREKCEAAGSAAVSKHDSGFDVGFSCSPK